MLIGRKTVLDYKFESEEEAKKHDEYMIQEGWQVISKEHYFIKNFRRYSRNILKGDFL
jgi:hypothetical protein